MVLAARVCDLGMVPGELTHKAPLGLAVPIGAGMACVVDNLPINILTPLTSMFLHGGWMHIIGNMWFLWLFGNNVEDSMTRSRFVAFYLLCGFAAAFAQVVVDASSATPMVGASGAISGIMGAYVVLFPHVRVFTIVPLGFYVTNIAVPAWVMLFYWAFIQFVGGVSSSLSAQTGGVAFWAHVGGFIAGVVLVKVFERRDRAMAHASHHWQPRRVGWR